MKLTVLRAIYFEGQVITEGHVIDTFEQHGRELIQKGYAAEIAGTHTLTESTEPEDEGKNKGE
ncbi:hypothetical protein KKJ25_16705 [Xenorhabdus bovienii]|uniref:DUF7210 family protein n=1 Tax=Xenorhabdus bovienii TaxID=40576 RepID=UPI00237D2E85|nr:hypothetical protein [Xenorhabdus bovienii]MDE1496526.1 hypothetical protein [Xenorhabdus bovienii]MDE9474496.1 hypothetical protein [Xenorhabdus bovienii]MDE9536326.1 hypothetical protein [Xenorhabdus bovienii]